LREEEEEEEEDGATMLASSLHAAFAGFKRGPTEIVALLGRFLCCKNGSLLVFGGGAPAANYNDEQHHPEAHMYKRRDGE
jgi:hypothetical protein